MDSLMVAQMLRRVRFWPRWHPKIYWELRIQWSPSPNWILRLRMWIPLLWWSLLMSRRASFINLMDFFPLEFICSFSFSSCWSTTTRHIACNSKVSFFINNKDFLFVYLLFLWPFCTPKCYLYIFIIIRDIVVHFAPKIYLLELIHCCDNT